MQFTHTFEVPVDPATTFATLTDLERVAPCLPGAVLEEVDGETYTGRVKVKVGPIQVTYRGTARVVEADEEAKRGRIEAQGKETRGAGTARADVTATLREADGSGTEVTVVTDLNITGKPAQFGRGVMADVGTRIIDTFAERLRAMLAEEEAAPAAPAAAAVSGDGEAAAPAPEPVPAGPRRIAEDPTREDDALDLMEVAGAATMKRLVPLLAGVVGVILLIWFLRRG